MKRKVEGEEPEDGQRTIRRKAREKTAAQSRQLPVTAAQSRQQPVTAAQSRPAVGSLKKYGSFDSQEQKKTFPSLFSLCFSAIITFFRDSMSSTWFFLGFF